MNLANRTPLQAHLGVAADAEGREAVLLVAKATFAIGDGMLLAGPPRAIQLCDSFHGEAGTSSPLVESEVAPFKPGADVVVVGHAHPPTPGAAQSTAAVAVGAHRYEVTVFGERRWEVASRRFTIGAPAPFERMPLIYERAFGGCDGTSAGESDREVEWRNPVGVGFLGRSSPPVDGSFLPNIESPSQLIADPHDRPEPAGFGFSGRHWQPRVSFAGTADAPWRGERAPLPPRDFDERHHLAAHPRLQLPRLNGTEAVSITGMRPGGAVLRFGLPGVRLVAQVFVGRHSCALPMELDTLTVFADEPTLSLVWRGRFTVGEALYDVALVTLDLGPVS